MLFENDSNGGNEILRLLLITCSCSELIPCPFTALHVHLHNTFACNCTYRETRRIEASGNTLKMLGVK